MQSQLNEGKKKLQLNAQNSQNKAIANQIFKGLKQTFEGIKDTLGKIEENRMHQSDVNDLMKQIQQKESKSFSEQIRIKEMRDL